MTPPNKTYKTHNASVKQPDLLSKYCMSGPVNIYDQTKYDEDTVLFFKELRG